MPAAFSAPMHAQSTALKRFLFTGLYRHERGAAVMARARQVVRRLFERFAHDLQALPDEHRARAERLGPRAIADYIAGMTDRFALKELARLGLIEPEDALILGDPAPR